MKNEPMLDESPQLISITEASKILNIHPNTLRRWDNQGLLKAVRLGSRKDRSYPLEEILKFTSSSSQNLTSSKLDEPGNGNEKFKHPSNSTEAVKRLDQVQLISAALSKLLTIEDVVNFINNHVVNLLNGNRAIVMMVDESGENLEMAGFYNLSEAAIRKNALISLKENLPSVEAIKYGQAIIIETQEEMLERFPQVFEDRGYVPAEGQAYVALPLETPSQKFGTVGICFQEPQRFSKDDISFMYYLARTYAQALERAFFYEKEKQKEREEKDQLERSKNLLEQINRAAIEFLNPMDLQETYSMVINEALRITKADYGSIFLLQGDRVERVYASDKSLFKMKARRRGDTYKSLKSKEAKIYIVKEENDPHPMLNRFGIKSILRIPVFYKSKSFGVINMLFKDVIGLTEEELEIFLLFGSLSALAIFNAKK